MKKNITMISRLLAFSFLVLMGVSEALAYQRALPQTSTDANPTYYLIMDLERGFYLRYTGNGQDMIDDQCTQLTDDHLWYFVASGNGYKIAPKQLNGQYLLNSGTYNSNYSTTGDTWLIQSHTSGDGYMVYTSTTTILGVVNYNNYWLLDRYGTSDYARVGRESGAISSRAGKFIFIPYDEVLANAQKNGLYLIQSRSTGNYLSQFDGDNNLQLSNAVTSNCIWAIVNDGESSTVNITSYMHDDMDALRIKGTNDLTLMPAHDAADDYYIIGGAQQHTIYADATREAATWGDGLTAVNDWMLVPYTPLDENDLNATEEDIELGRFFRIENYSVSHAMGATATINNNQGGWLEDIDHRVDSTMRDAAGNRVDFYCLNRDMTHASALWEIELAVKKSDANGDDQATGVIVGKHTHNIYRIRNANTNKYIGEVQATRNGETYLPVVRNIKGEKGQAAGFWFEPITDGQAANTPFNGQYRIAVYNRYSTTQDLAVGYLVAENATNDNSISAGLKIVTTPPTINSNGAWYLREATKIDVAMHTIGEKSWATAFYPFDVMITGDAETYTGEWDNESQQNGIILNKVTDVPAGNGVIIVGEPQMETCTFAITEAMSNRALFAGSPFKGIVESESYPIHQLGSRVYQEPCVFGANDSTTTNYSWGYYYVLSGNTYDHNTSNVGMYHPSDWHLMANKAYTFVENPATAPGRFLFTRMQNAPETVTAIEEVVIESEPQETVIYDMMGRRVVNPTRGIYIVNGKKVFIQ